jgi:general secretion pathway protein L
MRSVGIDIGSYSVKICVAESTKKGLSITQYYEQPIFNVNPLDRELEVIEYLRTQLSGFDPINTRFVLGLPQDLVSIRYKIFPFRDRIKILKSLPFELEEDLPFATEDTIFDGRITRMDASQSEVLACATPSDIIKKYAQFMKDSNFQASLLTPDGLAFSNLFTNWQEAIPLSSTPIASLDEESGQEKALTPSQPYRMVLNLGFSKSLALLFDNERLIDVRSLSWGGKSVAEALSRKYEFPMLEALKQLQSSAFILTSTDGATSDQIFYSTLITSAISDLIKDLKFTIIEFQSLYKCTIASIAMTGGISKIQNLGPFITQGLEIPVNRFSVLEHFPDVQFEKSNHVDVACGTVLGLALEGLRKPRNPPLNLLKGEFAQKSNGLVVIYEKWGDTLKYGLILFVIFFIYSSFRYSFSESMVESAIETMKNQAKTIAKLKGSKASEANIKKFIKEKKKVIKDMKTLSGIASMNSAVSVMKKINDAIPSKQLLPIELSKISIKEKKVILEGYVAEAKDVQLLEQAFKNLATGKIQNSTPPLPAKGGRRAFHFEFDVDRNTHVDISPKRTVE